MFEARGFLHCMQIDCAVFLIYIKSVRVNYEEHPYHNYQHAVEVLHFFYLLDWQGALRRYFNEEQRFALFLAALNHDIAHPGKSAEYQKQLFTELYEKYGDTSTLEKYHFDVAKALWRDPQTPILSEKRHAQLESYIEKWVIATDMQRHSEFLSLCKNPAQDPILVHGILLIKCADLSQFVRGKELRETWSLRLKKELYLEKAHQMAQEGGVSLDYSCFPGNQLYSREMFLEKMVTPLYSLLVEHFPSLESVKKKLGS